MMAKERPGNVTPTPPSGSGEEVVLVLGVGGTGWVSEEMQVKTCGP